MPQVDVTKQLTTTEHALLGMLARYGESSGYALLRQAEEGVGFFWSPAKSHVYDVLPRLAQRGLARRRLVPQVGKPDKHLWRLTTRGRVALRRWINTPEPDPLGNLSMLLLKVFFGDHGDPASLVTLVERFGDQLSARLAALRRIDAEAVFAAPQELPRMTLRLGLAELEAHLAWAEANLPELRARLHAEAPPHLSRSGEPTTQSERR
ncbi:MAG: helix-turn-helix transcriptional regulator [Solirubrobacteraceae bacterium]